MLSAEDARDLYAIMSDEKKRMVEALVLDRGILGREAVAQVMALEGGPGEAGSEGEEGESGDEPAVPASTSSEAAPEDESTDDEEAGTDEDEGGDEEGDEALTEEDEEMLDVAHRRTGVTDDPLADLRDAVEDSAAAEARTSSRYVPFPAALRLDHWHTPPDAPARPTRATPSVARGAVRSSGSYEEIRAEVAPTTSALRSKIAAFLRARSQRRMEGDRERGVVDSASLYSLRLGNRSVFAERTPQVDVNTAFSIVVDLSGSMASEARSERLDRDLSRVQFAQMAVVALGETLSSISVPFEVIGFDNDRTPDEWRTVPAAQRGIYSRYMGFRYWRVKLFNESWSRAKLRVPSIGAGRENVDGEAVLFAARRLLDRKEDRRVLLVFSDGIPQGGCDHEPNQRNLRDVIRQVAAAGVEVIGVGVQSPEVTKFYKGAGVEGFNLNDLDALAPAVVRALKKRMVDRRQ